MLNGQVGWESYSVSLLLILRQPDGIGCSAVEERGSQVMLNQLSLTIFFDSAPPSPRTVRRRSSFLLRRCPRRIGWWWGCWCGGGTRCCPQPRARTSTCASASWQSSRQPGREVNLITRTYQDTRKSLHIHSGTNVSSWKADGLSWVCAGGCH